MYEFGWLLLEAREESGLTQADVAKRLGVSQQTVSRWESGASRPRRPSLAKLANLLGGSDRDGFLRRIGGGRVAESGQVRPVRPLVTRLPVASLTSEDFERFCRDFIGMRHRGAEVYRYGGPGEAQDGIDLVAELLDGTVVGYQCKRVKQFGPKKLRTAVDAIGFDADRYVLLLSRPASAALRREAIAHPKWSVEDIEDVSAAVRIDLSPHHAKRLVDTYFPGWSKDFLGITSPGVWLTADEFFRPSMRPSAAISHGWNLVGRSEELAAADRFMASDQKALVISGRGGIGKTRLLRALADRVDRDAEVLLLAPDTEFRLEDMELLPTEGFVVIVDDAHNRGDVASILAALSRHPSQDWKLIFTTRPYSRDRLVGDLLANGPLTPEDPVIEVEDLDIKVEDLAIEDTEALASEVLSEYEGPCEAAPIVAGATRDCPLFTVIAAKLVATKQLDPRDLGSDPIARSMLISRFRDAIIGELGDPAERPALRELLELVALCQPVIAHDEAFQNLAQGLLGQRTDRALRGLRVLEEAGVLVRRGRQLRVVPDLLGDFLVADSCVDPATGSSTRFAEAVFAKAEGALAQNVIMSVARLDWRVSRERERDSTVLDGIWESLTRDLVASGMLQREATLLSLTEVSYYQPRRALNLVRVLLKNPPDPEDPYLPAGLAADHLYRLNGVAKFLRNAAYSIDFVGEVCDLLWTLGRDEEGNLPADPDHPVRILQDIASIRSEKPREFLMVIADRAVAWTQDPRLGSYRYSPLDVLEPLVATDGRDTEARGGTFRITPFVINPDAVRPLRDRSIDTAVSLLNHSHLRVGVRAARFLRAALRSPTGQFRREPTSDELSSWAVEFCQELDRLGDFLRDNTVDPIIGEEIRQAVRWHATYGEETRDVAHSVLALLDAGVLLGRVTRVLAYGWADEYPVLGQSELDYEEVVARWRSIQRQVAGDLKREAADAAAAVDMIEERIGALMSAGSRSPSSPEPFLSILCDEWKEVAEEILTRVTTPSSPMRPYTRIALSGLRTHRPHHALEVSRRLIHTGIPELAAQVADALTLQARSDEPTDEELATITKLSVHHDATVRVTIARGLRFATGIDQATRLGLIAGIPIDGDLSVAEAVVDHFGRLGDFNIEETPPSFIPRILDGLVACDNLDDYTISEFLAEVSALKPREVLDLYTARVDHDQDTHPYDPLPHHFRYQPPLRFRESGNIRGVIHRICDWALEALDDWRRFFWAPDLFALAIGNVDGQVLDLLDNWAGTSDPRRLQVAAHLLRDLPDDYMWESVDWVNNILERAYALGDDCYNTVSAELHAAVTSGVRTGDASKPFPADIKQRDRSLSAAATLTVGSPAHRFYTSLVKSAQASIRWTQEQHEERWPSP